MHGAPHGFEGFCLAGRDGVQICYGLADFVAIGFRREADHHTAAFFEGQIGFMERLQHGGNDLGSSAASMRRFPGTAADVGRFVMLREIEQLLFLFGRELLIEERMRGSGADGGDRMS